MSSSPTLSNTSTVVCVIQQRYTRVVAISFGVDTILLLMFTRVTESLRAIHIQRIVHLKDERPVDHAACNYDYRSSIYRTHS